MMNILSATALKLYLSSKPIPKFSEAFPMGTLKYHCSVGANLRLVRGRYYRFIQFSTSDNRICQELRTDFRQKTTRWHRHSFFQFLDPVQDDVDLGRADLSVRSAGKIIRKHSPLGVIS